jgi:hypothetical protein
MSDELKDLLEVGKFISPSGLPGIIVWIRLQGRRLRSWSLAKSRVPICLAIESDNTHDARLIQSIAHNMDQYVAQHHLSSTVEVQVVSDDLKNTIGLLGVAHRFCERHRANGKMPLLETMPADFRRLHAKRRARMYVFGHLVQLTSSKGDLHQIQLEGVFENRIVRIPANRSMMEVIGSRRTRIESAFSGAHFSNIDIPSVDENAGMHFVGAVLVSFVQTLIGLGASIQDDPISATELLDQLLNDLSMDSETKNRLLNLLIARAGAAVQSAFANCDWNDVQRVTSIIVRRFPDNYSALMARTYAAYFVDPKRPVLALQYARQATTCPVPNNDGTWHYDLAFLLAQNGYFEESLEQYDELSFTSYKAEEATVASVLTFFHNELRRRPLAVHILFIVGFIEWKKLGSQTAYCRHAKKMFKRFVRLARSPELKPWVDRANVYIQKITKRLQKK